MPMSSSERARRYREKHPERSRAAYKRWLEANPEKAAAARERWAKANPDRVKEHQRKTDARPERRAKMNERNKARYHRAKNVSADTRDFLDILRDDPCAYCKGPAGVTDHIVPVAHDGEEEWHNRTAACRSCNARKGTRSLLTFLLVETR